MRTRFAVSFAVLAAACGAASADGSPYGSIAGGFNYERDQDFGGTTGEQAYEEGALGVVSLGYALRSGWRPELEYGYRHNDADGNGGETKAQSGMANLWYDFGALGFAPRLLPYIGGGVGSAQVELDRRDAAGVTRSDQDTVTAWQAGAGVQFAATRNLGLSLGYRWLETEKMSVSGTPGTPGTALSPGTPGTPGSDERYRSDGVLAALRYDFGRKEPARVAAAEPPPVTPAPANPVPTRPPEAEVAALELVVRPVNFQLDRTELTEPSRQVLDEIAARLAGQPDVVVTIEGHADATGDESYNQTLGQRRAEVVRDYLASKGVDRDHIEVASKGESEPVADNDTPEGRARNRRAEVNKADGPRVKIVVEEPSAEQVEAAKEPAK